MRGVHVFLLLPAGRPGRQRSLPASRGEITTAPMARLPMVLIPAYLVPLFVMLHLAALFQAARPNASRAVAIGVPGDRHQTV